MTFQHLEMLMRKGFYIPELTEDVTSAVTKAMVTKLPLLLSGPAGCGKTLGVYYVAKLRGAEVFEFNASDDLRLKQSEKRLRAMVLERHSGERIILLDELEKTSNLEFIIKLVFKNKQSGMGNNTVIIATSNNEWELGRKKIKVKADDKVAISLLDVFGSYVSKIKPPYKRTLDKYVKRFSGKKKLTVQTPRDLRYLEKIALGGEESHQIAHKFQSSFEIFSSYMEATPDQRPLDPPTAKALGGRLEKWLIVNALGESNLQSFVKKSQAEFFQIFDVISKADLYWDQRLLTFLPSFRMWFNSYKHPSTILRTS